ncbi:MAG: hypothetical protein ACE366_14535 [Bradymonadia bacterium]
MINSKSTVILALSLALAACQQGQQGGPTAKAPEAKPTPVDTAGQTTKGPNPADGAAAKALFDKAVTARLMGDEVAHQQHMVRLAAFYPETRHGRQATNRIGGGVGSMLAVTGILAAVSVPAFVRYNSASKAAIEYQATEKVMKEAVPVPYPPPPPAPVPDE